MKILGRLRYRTSYGQNVLKHTLEVVHLAGVMATELEARREDGQARRAPPRPRQGDDARGRGLARAHLGAPRPRYGESQGVVHAIEAHHYEVQPQTVEAVLLIAADAISASRPGARGESLEHYIKRLEALEELAEAHDGRRARLRAPGGPRDPRDRQAERDRRRRRVLLSHEIAREIEDNLEYPGPGQGDGDPRVARGRRRPVTARGAPPAVDVAGRWTRGMGGGRASVARTTSPSPPATAFPTHPASPSRDLTGTRASSVELSLTALRKLSDVVWIADEPSYAVCAYPFAGGRG